jgi:hypothetical protein
MFTPVLPEPYKLEDVFDAWVSAAHDASDALDAWSMSAISDRRDAYMRYCASLDREEHAAAVLAAAARRRDRRVLSDDLALVA